MILVCDASVVVKWFDARCESEVAEARRILNAHRAGALRARVLDLTYYEFGNALTHKGWQRRDVTAQLDDLELVCGEGLPLTPGARALAAAYAAAAAREPRRSTQRSRRSITSTARSTSGSVSAMTSA